MCVVNNFFLSSSVVFKHSIYIYIYIYITKYFSLLGNLELFHHNDSMLVTKIIFFEIVTKFNFVWINLNYIFCNANFKIRYYQNSNRNISQRFHIWCPFWVKYNFGTMKNTNNSLILLYFNIFLLPAFYSDSAPIFERPSDLELRSDLEFRSYSEWRSNLELRSDLEFSSYSKWRSDLELRSDSKWRSDLEWRPSLPTPQYRAPGSVSWGDWQSMASTTANLRP